MSTLSQKILMAAAGGSELQPDIEDVFALDAYGGNYASSSAGSDRTIPNGIRMLDYGGMVWIRSGGTLYYDHSSQPECWFDTERGADKALYVSENNYAQQTLANSIDFSNSGILVGQPAGDPSYGNYPQDASGNYVDFNHGAARAYNTTRRNYNMYTFRRHPKFFDIRTVNHNNSSPTTVTLDLENPGFVVVKSYDLSSSVDSWCWHRGFAAGKLAKLNTNNFPFTSTVISVSNNTVTLSTALATGNYVISAWNHDTSSTGLVQCFSLATNSGTWPSGTHPYQDLGWMPQWVLTKRNDSTTENWLLQDQQLGFGRGGRNWAVNRGFTGTTDGTSKLDFFNGGKKLYHEHYYPIVGVAIRKGPMKTPTAGTQVYYGQKANLADTSLDTWSEWLTSFFTGWPVDWAISRSNFTQTTGTGGQNMFLYRFCRGSQGETRGYLVNQLDETRDVGDISNRTIYSPTGLDGGTGASGYANYGVQFINWMFRTYPETLDVTYYRGDATNTRNVEHNLGVAPEAIIFQALEANDSNKRMVGFYSNWLQNNSKVVSLCGLPGNSGASWADDLSWGSYPAPTSSVFTVGSDWNNQLCFAGDLSSGAIGLANNAGQNVTAIDYAAICFATKAGVSKVGSITHTNGNASNVDCGFSSGARYVLMRDGSRAGTISNVQWYMFSSVQGITTGADDYLAINYDHAGSSVNGQIGLIQPYSSGFKIVSTAPTCTYIFIAFS
jgi:hypothetical protein